MNQVNKSNCLLLADYLENKVKEEEFILNEYWCETGCKTVGCAAGHAIHGGLIPDVELIPGGIYADGSIRYIVKENGKIQPYLTIVGNWLGFDNYLARMVFYAISYSDLPERVTKKDVIERLRAIANEEFHA